MQLKRVFVDNEPKLRSRQAKRRYKLWQENPNCFWCGRPTIWRKKCPKPAQDDFATLDHIYSRLSGKRLMDGFVNKTVLSCYKCNHDRGRVEYMLLPITEQWRRSNRFGFRFSAP